jgi:hypothetical protein
MNTSRKGAELERRFLGLLVKNFGYTVLARAVRTPYYRHAPGISTKPQVLGGGPTDLALGSTDAILAKLGERLLFVQVTTHGSESPHRAALRAARAAIPREHAAMLMAAWDTDSQSWRLCRDEADFLDDGWRLGPDDTVWPWQKPIEKTVQERLI